MIVLQSDGETSLRECGRELNSNVAISSLDFGKLTAADHELLSKAKNTIARQFNVSEVRENLIFVCKLLTPFLAFGVFCFTRSGQQLTAHILRDAAQIHRYRDK